MCTKSRFWGAAVKPDALKVIAGEEALSKYWNNPIHHFYSVCGVKVFGRGVGADGNAMAAVSLAALDDLDPRDWASAPVYIFDGRHDRFDRQPDFTGHL